MDPKVLLSRLRRAKPTTIRVFVQGRQDADVIKVSTKRDRWSKALETVSAMNWQRLDLMDSQGLIIETVTDEEGDDSDEKTIVVQSEEERWLNLMINAQRLALENQAAMLNPLVDGYVNMVNMFSERLAALEKHYDQTLNVAYQNAILQAQADSGGDDTETEIVKALIERFKTPKRKLKPHKAKKEIAAAKEDA